MRAVGLDQLVGVARLRDQCGAQRARLDRQVGDPGLRQLAVHRLDEALEAGQHVGRRRAFGEVVVAGIDDHQARLVRQHQLRDVLGAVGQARAAEAALRDDRQCLEVLLEAVPQADRRAADEEHAAGLRRLLPVGRREQVEALLPALGTRLARLGARLRRRADRPLRTVCARVTPTAPNDSTASVMIARRAWRRAACRGLCWARCLNEW